MKSSKQFKKVIVWSVICIGSTRGNGQCGTSAYCHWFRIVPLPSLCEQLWYLSTILQVLLLFCYSVQWDVWCNIAGIQHEMQNYPCPYKCNILNGKKLPAAKVIKCYCNAADGQFGCLLICSLLQNVHALRG